MSLAKAEVSRKSGQLRKVLLPLDKLLADTKDSTDLASFGRKYPAHLDTIKSDLKQARKLLYEVAEKLDLPVRISGQASRFAWAVISVDTSTDYSTPRLLNTASRGSEKKLV